MAFALSLAAALLALAAPAASQAATGDFDGNGFDDLAIGTPDEDVGAASVDAAGAVNVLYGRATGLSARGDDLWTQDSPGVRGVAEDGDHFGAALASGDFDGDGFDDLAIGAPSEDLTTAGGVEADAGAVSVLYGSGDGLRVAGNQSLRQHPDAPGGGLQAGAAFGSALLATDFNRDDGRDELVVGAPRQDISDAGGPNPDAGVVAIVTGRSDGLAPGSALVLSQGGAEVEGDDLFGSSLTAGTFTGDRFPDLVLGAIGEDEGGAFDTGSLLIFLNVGTTTALAGPFTQEDIGSLVESNDRFGDALVAADFGRSGRNNLAIGMPREDVGSTADAGVVVVVYTESGELDWANPDSFLATDVGDAVEASEAFGASLAALDLTFGPQTDLAVGVPLENSPTAADHGAVGVIPGDDEGLSHAGGGSFTQDPIGDAEEPGDLFGATLAAGRFGRGPRDDLAIGSPWETLGTTSQAGLVHTAFGEVGPFGPLDSQRWHQNRRGVRESAAPGDHFGTALAPPGAGGPFDLLGPTR